jgi:hypothetical protein
MLTDAYPRYLAVQVCGCKRNLSLYVLPAFPVQRAKNASQNRKVTLADPALSNQNYKSASHV